MIVKCAAQVLQANQLRKALVLGRFNLPRVLTKFRFDILQSEKMIQFRLILKDRRLFRLSFLLLREPVFVQGVSLLERAASQGDIGALCFR